MKRGQRVFSRVGLFFMIGSFCLGTSLVITLAGSTEQNSDVFRRFRNKAILEFLSEDQTGWRKPVKEKIIADLGEWAPERWEFVNRLVEIGVENEELEVRDVLNSYLKGEYRLIRGRFLIPVREFWQLRKTPEAILMSLELLEPWQEKEDEKKLIEKLAIELLIERKKVSGEKVKQKILEEVQEKVKRLSDWWEYESALARISHGDISSAYKRLGAVIKSPPSESCAIQAKVLQAVISCSRIDVYQNANPEEKEEWLENLISDIEELFDESLEVELTIPKAQLEEMIALKEIKEEFARKLTRELESIDWHAFAKYPEEDRKRQITKCIRRIPFDWNDVKTWSIPTWEDFRQVKECDAFMRLVEGILGGFEKKDHIYFARGKEWNSNFLGLLSVYLDPVMQKLVIKSPPRLIKLLEEKKLHQRLRKKFIETITPSE